MSKRWGLAATLVITAICLVVVLWGMELEKSVSAIARYRILYAVPVFALFASTFALRTHRFQLLLDAEVPFRPMLSVVAVSFLAINVVPLRMGELVRPYLLSEKHGVPFAAGVAAVVVERLLDVLALLTLVIVTGALVDVPQDATIGGVPILKAGLRGGAIVATFLLIVVIGMGLGGRAALGVLTRGLARLSPVLSARVATALGPFVDGLAALLRRPGRAVVAMAHTAGIWSITLVAVGIAMAGMPGLEVSPDRVLVNWTGTLVAMTALPTPGFAGAFEAGSVASLGAMGGRQGARVGLRAHPPRPDARVHGADRAGIPDVRGLVAHRVGARWTGCRERVAAAGSARRWPVWPRGWRRCCAPSSPTWASTARWSRVAFSSRPAPSTCSPSICTAASRRG